MAEWPYNTGRWQRLRAHKLALEPLCEDCNAIGRTVVATCVDHRHAISQGGEAFPSVDELASLCWRCHSRKTARGDEAGQAKTTKPLKGCTVDGIPLDPKHHWR